MPFQPSYVAYAVSDNQTVQQQKKGMVIKGKVLGTDGEPIIGASVLVKGSTTGVDVYKRQLVCSRSGV